MSINSKAYNSDFLADELAEEMIPNIPLPNEIPPLPNLSELPAQVLHSGTVETLIGQNEDLFARLKVSFRTNAELERKLMMNEQNEMELKHINSSLLAQIQVWQEKDKAQKLKNEELEGKIQLLNAVIETEQKKASNVTIQLEEKGDAFESTKSRLMQAAEHITSLERALLEQEDSARAAKARHETAVAELQNQLQSGFDARLNEVINENQKLSSELKEMSEKLEKLKNVSELRAEAENRLVFFERRAEELENRYSKDISDVQSQLSIYRTEAKSLSLQLHNAEEKMDQKSAENVRLKEALTEVQDQFESLQTLWGEAQKRLEESRLKYDSLHKINQELSRKLKEQRSQSVDLSQVEELNAGKEEKFERLESLLAGIQAGFPRSLGMIEESDSNNQEPKAL